jgi:hypothetical protein
LIDITDGVNYLTFKNNILNELLYDPIRAQYNDFDNFTPKEKHDLSNDYFNQNLAEQFLQLIENQ